MVIENSLKEQFGFKTFLPGQREVIESLLAKESAAAIFPTGAGKSLCYQLPALHLEGLTLVVSPLLSLMKDQLAFLTRKNIAAVKLDSGMDRVAYQEAVKAASDGTVKVLMISVERFKNERFRRQLQKMRIDLLVVDEAHCISEWGHNFRPDYLKIPAYRRDYGIRQVLLLTATATPKVIEDMCGKFDIPHANVFSTGFFRPNLQLQVVAARRREKDSRLIEQLHAPPQGAAIVYVTLQKTAQNVAEMLSANGFDAAAYHAGMKNEERETVQNRFMDGGLSVVVATIAFGMGIDKKNIRKVIHYNLPKSIENYSQEIGRAGRDGEPAACLVLGSRADLPVLENFVYGDTPELDGIRTVLDTVLKCGESELNLRLHEMSRASDIRLLPLKTLMVYLEIEGIVTPLYTYFEEYPFKCVVSAKQITDRFTGERKRFVEKIFQNTRAAKIWHYPDIDAMAKNDRSERKRVLAALEYFDENGWIELRPKSAVEVYSILENGFDLETTAERLADLFKEKEAADIERIHQAVRLFESPSCIAESLSAHFGEKMETTCGHCTFCTSKKPVHLPEPDRAPLTTFEYSKITNGLADADDAMFSIDSVTRFLCGVTTPKLLACKATRMPEFGRLSDYPYRDVRTWVERHHRSKHPAS